MPLNKKRVIKKTFNHVIESGFFVSSPFFNLKYDLKQDHLQYAVVVPKGIKKKATDRNKLKRRGYSILRSLEIQKGVLIFFYKKEGTKASFKELKKDIIFLIQKIGLIN